MSLHDTNGGPQLVAAAMDILSGHNVHISTGSDMGLYRALIAKWRPEQPLGAPFDPDRHPLGAQNLFWIVGRDDQGRVVHTQAMRLIDLADATLAEYLRDEFRGFPPVGLDLDLPRSRYRAGPGARQLRGRAVYHGEFWLSPDTSRFRGNGLSGKVGRFAFMMAMQRWAPDCVFGFMANKVAWKGFAARHGYMHTEPGAVNWTLRGSDTTLEGFMVYNTHDDLRYVLSLPAPEADRAAQAA